MAVSTRLLHADDGVSSAGLVSSVAPPVSVSTTFVCRPGETAYTRDDNPTRCRAEAVLGDLEGGEPALLYSSGQAATFAALFHFAPRRVAIASRGYHGTHQVISLLQMQGVVKEVVGLESTELGPGDVVWLETPRNPTCAVVCVRAASERAHAAGALLVVDGTFAPPPLQFCLHLGADVVMHSSSTSASTVAQMGRAPRTLAFPIEQERWNVERRVNSAPLLVAHRHDQVVMKIVLRY